MHQLKRILLLGTAVVFALCGPAHAVKRYEVKSGYIKYENTHGTEELYWKNFGEQEARYQDATVSVFGMTKTTRTVNIIDGKWGYSYELGSNTATKIDHEEMMKQVMGAKGQQPRDFSEQMLEAFGAQKVGTDTVLGKKTTVYNLTDFGDYKVWVYKGLALKAEMQMMGFDFSMKAVEFKENASIDQAKLSLPAGIQIVDADVSDMPSAEEMQQARDAMKQLRNDPEMQEAMRQMKELQNSPELQDAMKDMQDYKNSPEYQEAIKRAGQAQNVQANPGKAANPENLAEDVGEIIKDETSSAVKSTIRESTRDVIGGGLKSLFNN